MGTSQTVGFRFTICILGFYCFLDESGLTSGFTVASLAFRVPNLMPKLPAYFWGMLGLSGKEAACGEDILDQGVVWTNSTIPVHMDPARELR